MQLVVEVEQLALRARGDEGLGLAQEAGDDGAGQLEQRLARRRAQVQEQHVGRRVRRPDPDVALARGAVETGLEQLAADQPGDALVGVDGAVSSPTSPKAIRTAKGSVAS